MKALTRITFLVLCAGLALSQLAAAAEVRVLAAASLTDVMKDIAASYEKTSGDKLVFSFAASNLLARQIQEGAPADLFFSADEASMDRLEKSHLVVAGSRKSLLGNRLVVVVPNDSTLTIATPQDLASTKIRYLALAEPQTVPAGIYAKEYLRRQKLWSKVIDRVIPTENVRAALAVVESGNVDAGIVYATDAKISKKVKVAYEVPPADAPKISYPVALITEGSQLDAAKRFLAYLESPPGLDAFRRYGFEIPAP